MRIFITCLLAAWLFTARNAAHAQAMDAAPSLCAQCTFSLRGTSSGALPIEKQFDAGASLAYTSKNGDESVQTDAEALFGWRFAPENTSGMLGGSSVWDVAVGPYWQRRTGDIDPISDRGVTVGLGGHIIPGHTLAGVLNFDVGATASFGKTLVEGGGPFQDEFVHATSRRLAANVGAYYQPGILYFRVSAGPYSDHVSGAPVGPDGRESGWQAAAQFSVYPLGFLPERNRVGLLGVAPLLTLRAQKQFDSTATGNRQERDYRLYTVLLSIPFQLIDAEKGFIPTIDIRRTIGADLLAGRRRSNITSVVFSVKY